MSSRTMSKILIVGDSQIENTNIKNALVLGGSKAVSTTDANEAKQVIIKNWPDLLVFSFYEISQAESFYRDLIFSSSESTCEINESILLCRSIHEVKAFDLCMNDFFYSYLLERPFGSEYKLRLCVHQLQEKIASKHTLQNHAAESRHTFRVMVVEDEQIQQTVMQKMLTSLGYGVLAAKDGQEALDLLAREALPQVILMDIRMPRMDGFEAIDHIKENSAWQKIPIIILSSHRDIESVTTGIRKGAVDFIVKPVGKLILKKKLDSYIHQSATEAEPEPEPKPVPNPGAPPST